MFYDDLVHAEENRFKGEFQRKQMQLQIEGNWKQDMEKMEEKLKNMESKY